MDGGHANGQIGMLRDAHVVATPVRSVGGRHHARIPLAGERCFVAGLFQALSEACHILGDPRVVVARGSQAGRDVDGEATGLHAGPRGGAVLVDVVARQVHPFRNQLVKVGADHLPVRLGAVEPYVGVAQVLQHSRSRI